MGISFTPETERMIEERVRLGGYSGADELVRIALEALEELQIGPMDAATWAAIDRAEEQIERGEVVDWSEAREQLRAKYLNK